MGRMAVQNSGQEREAVNVVDNWISLAGEGDIASSRGPRRRCYQGGVVMIKVVVMPVMRGAGDPWCLVVGRSVAEQKMKLLTVTRIDSLYGRGGDEPCIPCLSRNLRHSVSQGGRGCWGRWEGRREGVVVGGSPSVASSTGRRIM